MTFLAHFTGTGIPAVLEMTTVDIRHFYNESIQIYNEQNKTPS